MTTYSQAEVRAIVEDAIQKVEIGYPNLRFTNRGEWTNKIVTISNAKTGQVGRKSTSPTSPTSEDTIGILSAPLSGVPGSNRYPQVFEAVDLVNGSNGNIQWLSFGMVTQNYIFVIPSDVSAITNPPLTSDSVLYTAYQGDTSNAELKRTLAYDYARRPQGADFDISVWAFRVQHSALMGPIPPSQGGKPLGLINAVTKHRPEWCGALGVPVIPVPPGWNIGDPV